MVANQTRDAFWTVCDAATGSQAGVTVIAGPPATEGERASALPDGQAVLAENGGITWLLWDGRRSAVDLADRAVVDGPVSAPRWPGEGHSRSPTACSTRSPKGRRWSHR